VTRLIQGLEEDLKVRLLHRTTRSVTVTAEGATYYERVVRLLADLADIESTTRLSQSKPSGKVRVENRRRDRRDDHRARARGVLSRVPPASRSRSVPATGAHDLVAEGIDCAVRVGEVTDN